ncbi:30S ribosomal protein S4 [candidate division KSB3 bacterium]|uniref:Small ribosomal subunit protein uS4 n=1 Tax=candidate division KSB3 bacterium TaxID=2044937 RepID=A0A2G6KI51_9BACT|nr:MAG: 30S ribosomal protein S4 [candidate division KSB3 bacterium]
MARNTTAKGKIVRRFGSNIFGNPKYDRVLERRVTPPGDHGAKRSKETEYGKRLLEKQKLRFAYGMSETQFKNTFKKAKAMKGMTGENLLVLLERRLDNVVYRLGMASSRSQARQMVVHGHIMVNGRKVTSPSFRVKAPEVISAKKSSKSQKLVKTLLAENTHRAVPDWLALSPEKLSGEVQRLPAGADLPDIADEQLVVEFYSR